MLFAILFAFRYNNTFTAYYYGELIKMASLTAFVLRVGHECLLHRLGGQHLVLLLHGGGGGGGHHGVRHHLEGLHQRDVSQLLGDREGSLAVL